MANETINRTDTGSAQQIAAFQNWVTKMTETLRKEKDPITQLIGCNMVTQQGLIHVEKAFRDMQNNPSGDVGEVDTLLRALTTVNNVPLNAARGTSGFNKEYNAAHSLVGSYQNAGGDVAGHEPQGRGNIRP